MSFIKDNAIIGQNAATAAATVVAALVGSGDILGVAEAITAFSDIRTAIFEGSLACAGVESPDEVPADAPRRSGGFPRRASGGGNANPGEVVINFGKHKGKTIAGLAAEGDEGREYVEWLAASSNNDFIKKVTREFLAA